MHELLLYGSVPASRYEQLLHVLGGVAAHTPQAVLERHLIYRPNRESTIPSSADKEVGGKQDVSDRAKEIAAARRKAIAQSSEAARQRMMRLVEEWIDNGDTAQRLQEDPKHRGRWTWRWYDTPDAGNATVTSRAFEVSEVDEQDPVSSVESQGYRCIAQLGIKGDRFVHGNVVLLLYRVLRAAPNAEIRADGGVQVLDNMSLLDPSGSYLVEARLVLANGTKPELISRGRTELLKLKDMMKGCLDLRPAARLALDTRAR